MGRWTQTLGHAATVGYDRLTDVVAIGIVTECVVGTPIMLWYACHDIKEEAVNM